MLVGALACRIPANAATNRLAAVGAQSYSIYLWHMALMYWLIPELRSVLPWEARLAIHVVGSLAIGVGMAKLLEGPLLRLRDRGAPAHGAQALPAPANAARRAA